MLNWRLVLITICLVYPGLAIGQQRPLKTEDAELLRTGRIRVELGIELLQGQRYSLSGLEGDLTRLGVSAIHVGVGEYAEFQISGVIQDFLTVSRRSSPVVPPLFSGDSTSDFGNLILASKLKLTSERKYRPSMAFKFAVELPNANQNSGLGTDETEFYASLLFKKQLWNSQILANVGFAILGSPVYPASQTDPLTYAAAVIIPLNQQFNLVSEIYGRQGPARLGNENQSQVRAGLQIYTGGLRWDIAGIAGLKQYDPDSGIAVGMTYEFQAFQRKRSPVTIK